MDRKKGFICYAHADKPMFEEVRRQLTALESAFPIDFWDDPSLRGGDSWDSVIKAEVAAADLFLLLFTSNWFASDYIQETELPAILSRVQATGSLIVPVILRGCRWQARFGQFQAVPTDRTGAILPVMNWHRRHDGYERVAEQIEGVLLNRMHLKPAPLTPPEALRGLPQDKGGAIWIKQDAAFVIVTGGDLPDAMVAQDTVVRQLHDRLREMAAALAKRLAVSAADIDPDLEAERRPIAERTWTLARGLAIETDAVPGRIGDFYSAIQTLGGHRDALRQQREVRANAPDPLSSSEYADLNDLVTQATLWIRQFPRARDLDAGSVIPSDLLRLIPLARTIITAAHAVHLIEDADAERIRYPLTEASDVPPEAKYCAVLGARNLLYRLGTFVLGFIPEAVLPGNVEDNGVADAVGGMLVEQAIGITDFLRGAPGEVGQAFGRLIAISRQFGLRAPIGLPSEEQPATPEPPEGFSLDEVKRRILAGKRIPAAWVPLVTALDLSFTTLSDITQLGELTALQALDLRDTEVSNVTPLGALTALQSLNLMRTRASDVTPLRALTALQSLDLWGTKVSDVTPLGTLAALQSLNLWGTKVSDVSPLGALTALRTLYLSFTPVSDVKPLAALTALRTLDLAGTKVSDVTLLASLRALTKLVLTGTRPTGVEALRRAGLIIEG